MNRQIPVGNKTSYEVVKEKFDKLKSSMNRLEEQLINEAKKYLEENLEVKVGDKVRIGNGSKYIVTEIKPYIEFPFNAEFRSYTVWGKKIMKNGKIGENEYEIWMKFYIIKGEKTNENNKI